MEDFSNKADRITRQFRPRRMDDLRLFQPTLEHLPGAVARKLPDDTHFLQGLLARKEFP